eukprot:616027-Prymnesium_polylepis.1
MSSWPGLPDVAFVFCTEKLRAGASSNAKAALYTREVAEDAANLLPPSVTVVVARATGILASNRERALEVEDGAAVAVLLARLPSVSLEWVVVRAARSGPASGMPRWGRAPGRNLQEWWARPQAPLPLSLNDREQDTLDAGDCGMPQASGAVQDNLC